MAEKLCELIKKGGSSGGTSSNPQKVMIMSVTYGAGGSSTGTCYSEGSSNTTWTSGSIPSGLFVSYSASGSIAKYTFNEAGHYMIAYHSTSNATYRGVEFVDKGAGEYWQAPYVSATNLYTFVKLS